MTYPDATDLRLCAVAAVPCAAPCSATVFNGLGTTPLANSSAGNGAAGNAETMKNAIAATTKAQPRR